MVTGSRHDFIVLPENMSKGTPQLSAELKRSQICGTITIDYSIVRPECTVLMSLLSYMPPARGPTLNIKS